MCVTMGSARLASTVIYLGEAEHEQHGLVHVLGYQNKPTSLSGPNAMLLHLPAANVLGPKNVIEMPDYPEFLSDLQAYMAPPPAGSGTRSGALVARPKIVQIFDTGIYTVVLASEASLIPDALALVDERKRPALNPALFAWYEEKMPRYQIALCCFDNADRTKSAAPLFWWFKPVREDVLFAPGIDAHDGSPPDLRGYVDVDTALVIGSFRSHALIGSPMMGKMPKAFAPFAPTRLRATEFEGAFRNGDYVVSVADLAQRMPTSTMVRRELLAL